MRNPDVHGAEGGRNAALDPTGTQPTGFLAHRKCRRARSRPHPIGPLRPTPGSSRRHRTPRSAPVRRLGGCLPREVDLGPDRQGHPPRKLLVPARLQLEHLREGGPRLPRRAGGGVSPDQSRRARLQPPWLPEGVVLQPPHVRRRATPASPQTHRQARRGKVAAHLLGAGPRGDRGRHHRHSTGARPGLDRLGSRHGRHQRQQWPRQALPTISSTPISF